MTKQLDRLQAALRYSSGSARRELARQIAEVEECERVEDLPTPLSNGHASLPPLSNGHAPAAFDPPLLAGAGEAPEDLPTPAPERWCSWCGETLLPGLAGDYCIETCQAEDTVAAELANDLAQLVQPQSAPQASESPTPTNEPSEVEPPPDALASAEPATFSPDAVLTGHDWWIAENRMARLKHLWEDEKWTASRIGEELGCSKNAVIGATHRAGLIEHRPQAPAPVPVVSSFLALGPGACCWPQRADDARPLEEAEHPGHRDFAFCGAPAVPGGPYCEGHHKRSLQRPGTPWTEERRNAAAARLAAARLLINRPPRY